MPDVVVTVPKELWLGWILEGDAAGASVASGEEWAYYIGGAPPVVRPGDRVYVVAHGRLRGYAPLVRLSRSPLALVRRAGAVPVTISGEPIVGFRGWRYRWWALDDERPFPDWRTTDVPKPGPRSRSCDVYQRLALLDGQLPAEGLTSTSVVPAKNWRRSALFGGAA